MASPNRHNASFTPDRDTHREAVYSQGRTKIEHASNYIEGDYWSYSNDLPRFPMEFVNPRLNNTWPEMHVSDPTIGDELQTSHGTALVHEPLTSENLDFWSGYGPFMEEVAANAGMDRNTFASEEKPIENKISIPVQHQISTAQHDPQGSVRPVPSIPNRVADAVEPIASTTVPIFIDLTTETSDSDADVDDEVVIGTVLKSGRFKCRDLACGRRSFGRHTELRRHYKGTHMKEITFWCKVPSCERSQGVGRYSFPRKDKLTDHVHTVHGGEL